MIESLIAERRPTPSAPGARDEESEHRHPRWTNILGADLLLTVSLIYLLCPYLLFAVGWLQPTLAVLVGVTVVVGTVLVLRDVTRGPAPALVRSRRDLLGVALVALAALLWAGLSGTGGVGYQNGDLLKDNTVLKDLMSRSWPVAYPAQGGEPAHMLDYYIAIYLLPASVGKWLGWVAANRSLFLEIYIGVLLGMLWFVRAVRTRRLFAASLIFMFASGLDIVGLTLERAPFQLGDHIQYWATQWQYSSNTTLAFWVPQQAIVGWIVTGILVTYASKPAAAGSLIFVASAAILWSPMVALGALALAGVLGLLSARKNIRQVVTVQNSLGALALLLPVGLMYLANVYANGQQTDTLSGHGEFIWQYYDLAAKWPKLVAFEVLEFGLFAVAVIVAQSNASKHEWTLLAVAIAMLMVLPVYRLGLWNVFVLRTSIPALFVLWMFVVRLVLTDSTRRTQTVIRAVVAMLLVLGAVAPVSEIARSFQHGGWRVEVPSLDSTPDMQTGMVDGSMTREHVGDPSGLFFAHLARGVIGAPDR